MFQCHEVDRAPGVQGEIVAAPKDRAIVEAGSGKVDVAAGPNASLGEGSEEDDLASARRRLALDVTGVLPPRGQWWPNAMF